MVKVRNLSLYYKENENALDDISFDVKKGECVLFTGKSGSGKSSIINSINGLSTKYDEAVSKGDVFIEGEAIKDLELYEISLIVSSVFQNPKTHFFNVNTTIELLFYLENIGLSREQMDERLSEMLEVFPIEHLLNRDIFKLSGGEKQILSIAASYISGSKMVVLDEPSSNLDEKSIEFIKEMLMKLKEKGTTIIISEHRIYYLMNIADRVIIVEDGRIKREYKTEDFVGLSLTELNALGLRDTSKTRLHVPESPNVGDLEIRRLEYSFKALDKKLKLKDMAFDFGKIYGLIGANGRGKSTFVRSFIGVDRRSKEEIYLDGNTLSKKDRLKLSSLVMQDINHQLFTDSVIDEIGFGIKDVGEERVTEILKELGLYELKDRHPLSLSGGQKQRVAIASVICKGGKFLFFDEPTSGMDYSNMMKISDLIKRNLHNDSIIFIVSHDMEFLNMTADYVVDFSMREKKYP